MIEVIGFLKDLEVEKSIDKKIGTRLITNLV